MPTYICFIQPPVQMLSHPETPWHILFIPNTWVPQGPVKLTYKITHPGRKHYIFIFHSCVPLVLGAVSDQTFIYWSWITVVIKMEKQILQFSSEAPDHWGLFRLQAQYSSSVDLVFFFCTTCYRDGKVYVSGISWGPLDTLENLSTCYL